MSKKFLSSIFGGSAPAVPMPMVNVGLTGDGFMIMVAYPGGEMSSSQVKVVDQTRQGPWPWNRTINLKVVQLEEGRDKLLLSLNDTSADGSGSTEREVPVYEGHAVVVAEIAQQVRQAWWNSYISAGQAAPGMVAREQVSALSAYPESNAGPRPRHTAVAHPPSAHGRTGGLLRRRGVAFGASAAAAVVLVVGGYVGATHWLKPAGPGIDLSSMSIDEVALLDANPKAMREVQTSLIEAMGVGRAESKKQAEKQAGKIEQDHIDALKAMGLNPGVSMKNAMNCLAK